MPWNHWRTYWLRYWQSERDREAFDHSRIKGKILTEKAESVTINNGLLQIAVEGSCNQNGGRKN